MKRCLTCDEKKYLDCFYFRKDSKKYKNTCIVCLKLKNKERYNKNRESEIKKAKGYRSNNKEKISKNKKLYYINNIDKIKEYREINSEKIRVYGKQYNLKHYAENRHDILENKKEYYKNNIERIAEYQEKWRSQNKEYIIEYNKKYRKANHKRMLKHERDRQKHDICFRLRKRLRSRLWCAIKSNQKTGSAVRDLGCTVESLKAYLESKFQRGMSWNNYGYYGWHIDHIKPLSSFDLTDRDQTKMACHYTNLQPLWAIDNIKKGNKEL